jgi:hypothetical protein
MLLSMRVAAALLALTAVAGGLAATASGRSGPSVVGVGCSQSLTPMNPGLREPQSGQRLVLDSAWLPKSSVQLGWPRRPDLAGSDRFIKYGVGVRASHSVILEVPTGADAVYALAFGTSATTVRDGPKRVRFQACPARYGEWTIWAGGYLVHRPACVPLTVRAGYRSARVSLALGRRCG